MKTAHKKICGRVPQTRPQDRCGGEGLGASFTLSRTQWRTHNQQRKHGMNAFFIWKFVHVPARLWSFQVFSSSVNFSLKRMLVQLYFLQSVGVRKNGVCLPRASHSSLRSLLSSACYHKIWLRVQNWVCAPVISPKYFRSRMLLISRSRGISDEIGVKQLIIWGTGT